ncbi:hypothetical protein TCAL_06766 [Tigriopus californicus]|uniref:protein-tyrosine-phosphatase n=1 Tax=Tigriopus californicus TaxID=6832 RepID=A0A553PKI6_TIGCA|nr:dual specificity protein phosphatase MPK-4-like [Tigriopus californicus]TRY78194.1 hypothetical protein TCAL_06766 [Tigriopus californicus]|eukprot:TCALIF_06766-PA protein Name:"Similar to Dusp12 Dual specificity protein phosphatase 12 (Mus musculus)" AED:0.06 eAED:0.06 QI:0/-1/0/1/-1/1/1/0/324
MCDAHPVDQIAENLFLGDKKAATDLELIGRLKLTHIVTAELIPLPHSVSSTFPHLAILHVAFPDVPEADLLTHLEQTTHFIREGVEYGAVLVHCYHGVSRSAAIVAAFLMRTRHWTLDKALALIRRARPAIGPNDGFLRQLALYKRMQCRLDVHDKAYKLYKLQCVSNQVKTTKILPHEFYQPSGVVETAHGPSSTTATSGSPMTYHTRFKCKKCRQTLGSQINVLPHERGQTLDWNTLGLQDESELRECQQGVFFEPLMWMGKIFSTTLSEKLHCNKCLYKLGSYSWVGTVQCACGGGTTPGFLLNLNRVDRCTMLKVVEADL